MTPARTLTVVLAAALSVAWLDPTRDRIAAGNRLYDQGKFDEAITKFGEALVDDPDSPLLNFNMGDAHYKAGHYGDAIASLSRVRTAGEAQREAAVAYNMGNAQYRLGAAAEAEKPQDALTAYAGALVAYRRALAAEPSDRDAKFNYEFVSKKIDDLKKKLEEQRQQQEEQPPADQQQADQPQDQPEKEQQDDQQAQQEKQDEGGQQEQASPQAAEKPEGAAQQPAEAAESGDGSDQMSRRDAAALIDAAKNDEVQPEEFVRRAHGGVLAEPAQDW